MILIWLYVATWQLSGHYTQINPNTTQIPALLIRPNCFSLDVHDFIITNSKLLSQLSTLFHLGTDMT
jgi:hypothetical protein